MGRVPQGLEPDSLGFKLSSTTYCVTWGRFFNVCLLNYKMEIIKSIYPGAKPGLEELLLTEWGVTCKDIRLHGIK